MSANEIGRLALRREGDEWVAYYALKETMEGAIRLASLNMNAADIPEFRDGFINLAQGMVGKLIEEATGETPTWGPENPAPESERAGHG